jgi:hypothetical protein
LAAILSNSIWIAYPLEAGEGRTHLSAAAMIAVVQSGFGHENAVPARRVGMFGVRWFVACCRLSDWRRR